MFEFLAGLTVFATWGVLGVATILLLIAIEYKNPVWATAIVILTAAGLQFLTPVDPLGWILANPLTALTYVAGYFVLGALYTLVRWKYHVATNREEIRSAYASFASHRVNAGKTPEQILAEFKSDPANPVRLRDHKSLVLTWLNFWPVSALWMAIHIPIKHGWQFIYANMVGVLSRIANSEIDKIAK